MFGKKKKNDDTYDRYEGTGSTLDINQKSPKEDVEKTPAVGVYFILGIAFLLLVSLIFLFYSVVPSIGFYLYQQVVVYLWKPMSWMPLWVWLLILFFMYFADDFFKPVVYFNDERKFYRRIYERHNLKHIKRLWGGEIIVSAQRVRGWGSSKLVTHRKLSENISGRNILLEGSDQLEVSQTVDLEAELKLKDERIAKLRRQLSVETARNQYYELELARIRSGGQRKND